MGQGERTERSGSKQVNPSCGGLTINAAPLALRQIPETFLEK
jgi:hypothetical protein